MKIKHNSIGFYTNVIEIKDTSDGVFRTDYSAVTFAHNRIYHCLYILLRFKGEPRWYAVKSNSIDMLVMRLRTCKAQEIKGDYIPEKLYIGSGMLVKEYDFPYEIKSAMYLDFSSVEKDSIIVSYDITESAMMVLKDTFVHLPVNVADETTVILQNETGLYQVTLPDVKSYYALLGYLVSKRAQMSAPMKPKADPEFGNALGKVIDFLGNGATERNED